MRFLIASILFTSAAAPASTQTSSLYDEHRLETVDLHFSSPTFWTDLVANHLAGMEQNIAADLTYRGVTYGGVGVRIKGRSSFTLLPPGSQKASLNIELDFTDPNLEIDGFKTLNLNNAFEDPTFCREVVFFNYLRDYMPAPRANHVVLRINGQNWGVYANVQQYNSTLLGDYFDAPGGARFKAVDDENGALQYIGPAATPYQRIYEMKSPGALANPWQSFVDVCDTVSNTPIGQYATVDTLFSIDSALWLVAGENLFMDKDSYIAKGYDYYVYFDPLHDQAHLHNYDGNESFGVALIRWPGGLLYTLPTTFHFGDVAHPVLQRLMQDPRVRERYYAHYRTLLEQFDWAHLGPKVQAAQTLIDAAVQADPKKLYTYAQFQANALVDVTILVGTKPVIAPGLRNFVDQRRAFLALDAELNDPAPAIDWVQHAPVQPQPGQALVVTARVHGPLAPLGEVLLYYRAQGRFRSTPMFDDGAHGDVAAGDSVFGSTVPHVGVGGDVVSFYVGAASAAGAGGAMVFEPRRAEGAPLQVRYPLGSNGLRFTEYMYSGNGPEFFELTNLSTAPLDLTGWSFDDDSATPGVFDLSAAGVIAPQESLVVTEGDAASFASSWALANVHVLGANGANLGRNDTLHVFDATGALHDRLAFGDQAFPGSVRAQNRSASGCQSAAGADDAYRWVLASLGDAQASWSSAQGDLGNPGLWSNTMACTVGSTFCAAQPNSTGAAASISAEGSLDVLQQDLTLRASGLPSSVLGLFILSAQQQQVPFAFGGQGTLCIGPPPIRVGGSTHSASVSGVLAHTLDFQALPGGLTFQGGQTWNFQAWFRDSNPTATTNFSSALEVTFH